MADKEERILIEVLGDRCCPVLSNDNICVLDYDCDDCKAGMTRQEAINRMAKAICKETNYQCSVCDFGDNKEKCEAWIYLQYKKSAEAALNALLEGYDDER